MTINITLTSLHQSLFEDVEYKNEMLNIKSSIVVALSQNRVIGRNNKLPWRLPVDLAHFKSVTMGKPIVMGRRTWESIGRPLPGRTHIVISGSPGESSAGFHYASDIDSALTLGRRLAAEQGVDEVMIIGGALVYRQTLDICDRIYMTRVHAEIAGDAWFPELQDHVWELSRTEHVAADARNCHACSFEVWDRKPGAGVE